MSDALKVSSDVFFYQLGEQAEREEPRDPALGEQARLRAQDRDRPPRRARRAWCPTATWRDERLREVRGVRRRRPSCTSSTMAALYKCGGVERAWTTGDNVNLAVGQGDLQATPLQVAVAYSALANNGTIVKPHLGKAIEDGNGVTIQELPHQAAAQGQDRPGATARSCSTACAAPPARRTARPPTSSRASRRVQGLRQDRHRRAPAEPRSGVVRLLRQGRRQADRGRRDGRARRLRRGNCGTRGAPDPLAVVRCEATASSTPARTRAIERQPIQPASEPPPPLVPREWRLRLDPLLLLATLGLVACSLIAIKGATADDIAGDPLYYVKRQAHLRRRRARPDVRRLAPGLLAPARVALPDLRRADGLDHRRARAGDGDARRASLDPAAGLQPAAVRARQGAAGRRAGRASWSSACARWAARRRPG